MRAIDTNVLVRALVLDDPEQSRRAQALLEGHPIFIPVTVILELEWVLRSRYGYSPKTIAQALGMVAALENAVIGEQAAVAAAAEKMGRGWDFADALHHSLSTGCDDFVTFDATLAKRARRDPVSVPKVALP